MKKHLINLEPQKFIKFIFAAMTLRLGNMVALTLAMGSTGSTATATCTAACSNAAENMCSVYIAKASSPESPIPISFYSGIHYKSGEKVPVYDLGVHLVDFSEHNPTTPMDPRIMDLMWTPSELISQYEDSGGDNGLALISGMAFAGTDNPGVCNVRWHHDSVVLRYQSPSGSLDHRVDPMAGAISESFGLQMITTSDIVPGMEFFPFFGDSWFEAKEEEAESKPNVYTKANYEKADNILKEFAKLLDRHKDYFTEYPSKAQDYWSLIRDDIVTQPKVRQLLPKDNRKVSQYAATGTAILRHPDIHRSLDYLQTRGACADNLVMRPSTIQGAGRGAFAKRALTKGDVVAPMPLVKLHSDVLLMLDRDDHTGEVDPDSEVVGAQLLMNYVLGHSNTDYVFYPYGIGVNLINHATYGTDKTANVRLVWSEKEYHDQSYLSRPIQEIDNLFVHIMDVVALRDIQENEEIFLDYGSDFDAELKQHQSQFEPDPKAPPKAAVLNQKNEVVRTLKEQQNEPYPKFVSTICYVDDTSSKAVDWVNDNNKPRMALPEDLAFLDPDSPLKIFNVTWDATEIECQIIHRDDDDSELYVVRLLLGDENEDKPYIFDVPRWSLMFLDQEYQSPLHNPKAFRHYIEIPSDIFPKAWIDKDDQDE